MRDRRPIAVLAAAAIALTGCSGAGTETETTRAVQTEAGTNNMEEEKEEAAEIVTTLSRIDNSKWQYEEESDVYWQVGISYCETPASEEYETLGIFVPGAYMSASENGDGTYTCEVNREAELGGYTAETAPIVIPVDTPGCSAMAAPTGYKDSVSDYTDAGFVYVNAGCRGRDEGAPAGVTDLKAAVRYIRYNEGNVPGNMDRIFTFGMSGGGAQSALMGATGDSALYEPYLAAIGAVSGVSDAVAGSMCWCPITNLDYANEAYEWNLGVSRSGLDEETKALSDEMAAAFAEYINELGLKDSQGNVLVLTESESGIYQAGSYYDYMKSEIEESLNHFLADTEFPYTPASGGRGAGGFGGPGRGAEGGPAGQGGPEREAQGGPADQGGPERGAEGGPDGQGGPEREAQGGPAGQESPEREAHGGGFVDENGDFRDDGINRNETEPEIQEQVTYETAEDYIASLNKDGQWILYDAAANTATITSVEDFVKNCKKASKNVGAFDDLEATQGENVLFGYGDGEGAHFDPVMAELLEDNEQYGAAYAADLASTDFLGTSVSTRVDMYNPMYYLSDYYEGYKTSQVAKYWRIRTGIAQGDTALSTEINLALALEGYGDLDVDFETVWAQGHTMAERTGSSTENFIAWVNECLTDQ